MTEEQDDLGRLVVFCDELVDALEGNVDALQSVDLNAFLRDTNTFDIESAERLRQLAIALESDADIFTKSRLRSWAILARVYDAAIALDPDCVNLWRSRGISALRLVQHENDQAAAGVKAGYAESRRSLLRALELDPQSASAACLLGDGAYFSAEGKDKGEALKWYDKALAMDPNLHWAQLYRAHCLHDGEHWAEAAAAYEQVDKASFSGYCAWRVDTLRDQHAACLLRSGQTDRAREDYLRLLDMLERRSPSWNLEMPHLLESVRSTWPDLCDRAEAVAVKHDLDGSKEQNSDDKRE